MNDFLLFRMLRRNSCGSETSFSLSFSSDTVSFSSSNDLLNFLMKRRFLQYVHSYGHCFDPIVSVFPFSDYFANTVPPSSSWILNSHLHSDSTALSPSPNNCSKPFREFGNAWDRPCPRPFSSVHRTPYCGRDSWTQIGSEHDLVQAMAVHTGRVSQF